MPPPDRSKAPPPPAEGHGFEVIEPPAPPRRARVVDRPVPPPAPRGRWPRGLLAALGVGAGVVLSGVGYLVYDSRPPKPFVPTEEQKAWQIEWEKDHPVAPQDTKAKPLPPELQALIDRSVLPLKERQRLDKEARANEQAAQAARVAAQDRAEAEQFRAVISAVRRNGRNLEIDYEFTKGWEVLDGPNGHRLAFVVSQGGSKSVYTPTFGEVKKAGTLRLREQSVFTSDARVEVQIVLLDVFQKPKASVSNPASAK